MLDRPSGEQVWRRLLGRFAAYELSSTTSVVPLWALFLGLADWRVYLGLNVVRIVGNYHVLHSSCEGYRRWASGSVVVGDQELLEIDRSLQTASRRFAITNCVGWAAASLISTVLVVLGLSPELSVGHAELLFGAMLMGAIVCGQWVTRGLFDPLLLDARAAVGADLIARRLDAQRQSTSIVHMITSLNVVFIISVFYGMLAIGGMAAVDGWRSTALVRQQLRVELGVNRAVQSGELGPEQLGPGELEPGMEVVEDQSLPPVLAEGEVEGSTLLAIDEQHALALAAAPLGDGRWLVAQAETDDRLWQVVAAALLLPPFFIVVFVLANRSTVGTIVQQLEQLRRSTQEVLTAGNLSGIKRYRPPTNDEVGRLATDFNGLLDVLDELAAAAQAVSKGDLAVEVQRPGELHEAFRGMLAQLRGVVTQIRATALELAAAASKLHSVSREQESVVVAQSRSIDEVGATIELLANAAERIAQTSTQVLSNAEQTLSNTDTTVARIGELNAAVGSITQLLEVIREVADRSDLLALNGSLEATRAGDAGRGFALVASEMRRLAERVGGSVNDVHGRVTDIGSAGTSTMMASAQSRELAERTAEAARLIWEVTATQHHDTQRVSTSVHEVVQSVAASATVTSDTLAAAETLRLQADELERLTRHFRIA